MNPTPDRASVAAVFPWRPGDVDRDAAARWVLAQWGRHHPGIQVATSADLPADGPWRKAAHLWHLTHAVAADILVVSDVDVWVPPDAIRDAIDAVATGQAPWAVPHGDVHRLRKDATTALMSGDATSMQPLWEIDLAEPPYPGHPGGGIVVILRDLADAVPLDPRYEGWGQEDDSWGLALRTIAGPAWRGRAPLVHLWHPPAARKSRRHGTRAGLTLYRRYEAAHAGTPGPMRALVAEARHLLTAEHRPVPAGHGTNPAPLEAP